ncbi:MAG: hypothetical protein ACI4F4_10335 [Lachnospiraceae bacterium]
MQRLYDLNRCFPKRCRGRICSKYGLSGSQSYELLWDKRS